PEIAKYDFPDETEPDPSRKQTDRNLEIHLEILEQRWAGMIPVAGPRSPQLSVVYFLKVEEFVRIATASRFDSRLCSLRETTDLGEVELLWTTPGARQRQTKLQQRFEHLRVAAEWFRAD